MEKKEIKIKPENILKVKDAEANGHIFYMSESDFNKAKVNSNYSILENLGNVAPNVKVFETERLTGRCFVKVNYEVVSETKLSENDFEILRILNTFMWGQYTGKYVSESVVDGTYVYRLTSELDSSD